MSAFGFARPSPGPSFSRSGSRGRARIAGASGDAPALDEAFRRALGEAALVLSSERPLVADADACVFEGRPVTTPEDWWRVVRANGFARVEGAFVLAYRTQS